MSSILPETGFVGFFDILGYTQIILNNNIHKTAQFVSDTLVNIPRDIIENMRMPKPDQPGEDFLLSGEKDEWRSRLDTIKWIIFSDSILVSMPFDPDLGMEDLLQHYAVFATVCATLLNRTFLAGFPIRGAISVGEFFIEERCFAGRPIINAYHLAQELEFSGCVLDDEANSLISNIRKDVIRSGNINLLNMLDQTTILYLVPMKNHGDERHRSINWVSLEAPGLTPLDGSIRDVVTRAFLMHNKIALPSVQSKINNTEMFVRHVLTNLEVKPWSIQTP
ncbi:MAG: hypothetical protein WA110_01055 [Anaerolineaceae bacterium]